MVLKFRASNPHAARESYTLGMPLLRHRRDHGRTPYLWLVYLTFFLIEPVTHREGWQAWLATLAGLCVFLTLYFIGYSLTGKRLLWVVAGMTLLGLGYAPFNTGSSVFIVFAAYFTAFLDDFWFFASVLAALVAVTGVVGWLLHFGLWSWVFTSLVSVVVGIANFHFVQKHNATRLLVRAHEEIEHLAHQAERARIARDLHDVLGHTLSVIIVKAELANSLVGHDSDGEKREIQDIERISRQALAEVRGVVAGYRSSGVTRELAQAEATLKTAGIVVNLHTEQVPLPPIHETALALAIREAVTNVVRHSRARNCHINLCHHDRVCHLEVTDDGCGGSGAEGNGLRGMRERVESLGGTVRRENRAGTRLMITLPLQVKGEPTHARPLQ